MTLVSSGEISINHATNTRSIQYEIKKQKFNPYSLTDGEDVTPFSLPLDMTDFYSYFHVTLYGYNHSSFNAVIRDATFTNRTFNIGSDNAKIWNTNPEIGGNMQMRKSNGNQFQSGDNVSGKLYESAQGESNWQQIQSWQTYTSNQWFCDTAVKDYKWELF